MLGGYCVRQDETRPIYLLYKSHWLFFVGKYGKFNSSYLKKYKQNLLTGGGELVKLCNILWLA